MIKHLLHITLLLLLALPGQAQLLINEIMASNATINYDEDYYNFPDWIELYNSSEESINLGSYYLSDDPLLLNKWKLPSSNLSPGSYFLLYCDQEEGSLHANFKLSADGERVLLSDVNGNIIDGVSFGKQYPDVSYGRNPDNLEQWNYCIEPTPDASNIFFLGDGQAPVVQFTLGAGRVPSGSTVGLIGDSIKYTLNGDEPGLSSSNYSSEITLSRTRTVKAKAFGSGILPSNTAANTYFVNEHTFTLPVVSLTFNDEFFYDDMIGIYVAGINGTEGNCGGFYNWNQPWERAAFLEFFDEEGNKQISQLIGVKVGGGCTRGRDQKSLSMYARSKYGDNDFDYRMFPTQKGHINTFKSLLLRNSGNDQDLTLLRDAFIQSLVKESFDIDHQSYQPATVYFNGEYRGIMNIREKVDEDYFLSNYNISSDEIDFLEQDAVVIRGSDTAYNKLLSYMSSNDLSQDELFAPLEDQIDLDEVMNYYATQIYIGNRDWPQNNIKYWKPKKYGKWRWIMFDTDYGLGFRMDAPNEETFDRMYNDNSDRPWSTIVFKELMSNESFKKRFLSRFSSLMHTAFNPDNYNPVLDSLAAVIDTEIEYNQEKYGRSKERWYSEIEILRSQAQGRYEFMQSYFRDFFQLSEPVNITIANRNPSMGKVSLNGVILQNYPLSITSYEELATDLEAVPAKGYVFKEWRTTAQHISNSLIKLGDDWKYLEEASSYPANWNTSGFDDASWSEGPAQIGYGDGDEMTEISFGGDSNNKLSCYLFRKNITIDDTSKMQEIDLGFVADDGGIVYINGVEAYRFNMNSGTVDFEDYAAQTVENENTVIYTSLEKSLFRNGENTIACEVHQASGTSSDMSFDLSLTYSYDTEVESEIYSTNRRIYSTTSSNLALEAIFEEAVGIEDIYINELASISANHLDELGEESGYIELYNASAVDQVLYGFYLSDDPDNLERYSIPDSTVIPANGYLLIEADGQNMQGALHTNFKLNTGGEELYLSQQVGDEFYILDSISRVSLPDSYSYGKFVDGTGGLQYMYQTPGEANKGEIPDIDAIPLKWIQLNPELLHVYPNPTRGMVQLELQSYDPFQEYYIEITDITGKQVSPRIWLNNDHASFKLEQDNGLYLVHLIRNGSRIKTEKLLIIR